MDISQALDTVAASGCRHGAGASDGEIREAEGRLGVAFPASYRAFLSRFGWAEGEDLVVYGLGKDIPPLLDLIVNTDLERNDDPGSELPPRLVPICPDGLGNHECLDLDREEGGDCPVVAWERGGPGMRVVSLGFAAWLGSRFGNVEGGTEEGQAGPQGRRKPGAPGRGAGRVGERGAGGEGWPGESAEEKQRRERLAGDRGRGGRRKRP